MKMNRKGVAASVDQLRKTDRGQIDHHHQSTLEHSDHAHDNEHKEFEKKIEQVPADGDPHVHWQEQRKLLKKQQVRVLS